MNLNRSGCEGKCELSGIFFRVHFLKILGLLLLAFIFFQTPAFCEERLSVTSKLANVRSGPALDNDVLWQVEKYHPILVLEKKSGWIKFKDFENDVAWIHSSLADKTNSVISIKDNCNVRKGPGTDYDVAFTVERGVPFKVLEKKGRWLNIEHGDGDVGWIYDSLVW
ncbi:SH3 domain-containing protein [Desulfamplus magnetovallimortis]|uniref:SH3 domain-containing protein n=1 Tax=Desulfamplus magnetovallimortis TaxID=1246637 RepID=UPI001FE9CCD5|nr:SH3 domain-containing protein [Desulfamplus magnetovallimortis]